MVTYDSVLNLVIVDLVLYKVSIRERHVGR